jgi:hypothetical protein
MVPFAQRFFFGGGFHRVQRVMKPTKNTNTHERKPEVPDGLG